MPPKAVCHLNIPAVVALQIDSLIERHANKCAFEETGNARGGWLHSSFHPVQNDALRASPDPALRAHPAFNLHKANGFVALRWHNAQMDEPPTLFPARIPMLPVFPTMTIAPMDSSVFNPQMCPDFICAVRELPSHKNCEYFVQLGIWVKQFHSL